MKITFAPLALFVILSAATAAQARSPLDDLIAPKAGASACFTRVYSADHLKKNPKQTTTSIAVRFTYTQDDNAKPPQLSLGVGLGLNRKGDALPWFAQGGCAWIPEVNIDTSGRRMIPAFRNDTGGGCMMAAVPDVFDTLSAEEGGYLIVDRGKDANTLMLYLQDDLMMVKMANRGDPKAVSFGTDDRTFMLQRADAKACEFVERALTR